MLRNALWDKHFGDRKNRKSEWFVYYTQLLEFALNCVHTSFATSLEWLHLNVHCGPDPPAHKELEIKRAALFKLNQIRAMAGIPPHAPDLWRDDEALHATQAQIYEQLLRVGSCGMDVDALREEMRIIGSNLEQFAKATESLELRTGNAARVREASLLFLQGLFKEVTIIISGLE